MNFVQRYTFFTHQVLSKAKKCRIQQKMQGISLMTNEKSTDTPFDF